MPESPRIAVIGGSGLYNMPEISDMTHVKVDTPFGQPSDEIMIGTLRGKRVAFLPRHGAGHVYTPSTVPYRANIYALKSLGVRFIIAVNACGSLCEECAPGNIVIPDQLVDFTKLDRGRTFFDTGLVAHVGVADPFAPELCQLLTAASEKTGAEVHGSGTLIVIEGPRFSTKGESRIFQKWGCEIIGMTTCPEAFLAREAEIAYATMAHVTDYDVWHETEAPVTVETVLRTMSRNLQYAQQAVADAIEMLDEKADWPSHHALENAIQTSPQAIAPEQRQRLSALVGRLAV